MIVSETIRMSILQNALQGKLTEQLPTDGSVEDLLITISKKKQQMIDDGVIKKEKKLPPITQDNIFEIPSSWQWVRMQNFLDVRDGTHDSPKYLSSGIPFVTSKNISSGVLDFSDVNYISKEDADKINQRSLVENNDILLAMIGSIGNPVKVHVDREFAIKNMALIKSVPDSNINMDYVLILLKYMQIKMKKDSSGGVQKFVSLSYLREFSVPLPPIEEQQRIVDRVNELLAKVDEFEKIENKLTAVKEKFPSDLRAAILQAAMQGKLTEQLDTDEPIEQLIDRCKVDKSTMIQSGKCKADKFTGELDIEISPYTIPDTWRVVHISDATLFQEGPGILAVDFRPKGVPLIRLSGMQTNSVTLSGCNYLDENMVKERWNHFRLDKGDVIISTSASMDKIAEVINTDVVGAIPYTGLIRFKMYGGINKEYFKYFIESPWYLQQINVQKKGDTIKHYGPSHLKKMIIPLPPIEEQQRIVERLDALLPLCDELTEENN